MLTKNIEHTQERKILAKIRFSPCNYMYFDLYYEITEKQNFELMKLNFIQNKHTCRHNLSSLVKKYKIDCSDMKLLQNISSCSFCKINLRELRYINFIEVDNYDIPLSTSSFPVEMLLFIIKEEEELSLYEIKINKIIDQLEKEKRLKEKEQQEKDEEERRIFNIQTYPVKCSSLRQNGFAIIDGHPCKIVAMTTSRD